MTSRKIMNSSKYRIPWGLRRALEATRKPSCLRATVNHLLMDNKYLKILKTLQSVSGPIEIDDCHYRQLLKLSLYLEEYERVEGARESKEHCTIWVERLGRNRRQFKVRFGDHWFTRALKVSDRLPVFEEDSPEARYFLRILRVCEDWVTVRAGAKFCQKFSESNDSPQKYSVEIDFNNYFFQCCHSALAAISASTISRSFFPQKTDTCFQELDCCSTWFNADISNDSDQKQAVYNIVNKTAFPAPYILYGPTGTGKTAALVEAVCQIWRQTSSDCILICTSSNVACDVVVKRLLNFIPNPNDLYRIYNDLCDVDKIDEEIKQISNYNVKDSCDALNKTDVPVKKIIITNLCTAWRLQKFQLPFSHVFIDEANQATQIESLIPLCLLEFSDYCQIVISGDNVLLGPEFLRSQFAWKLFGHSILEKLMKNETYKKDATSSYDRRYITKFVRNYRNCPEIIQVSNELFYNSEVIACGNQKINTHTGITVHCVEGAVLKPANSKSSFNMEEVTKVLLLVEKFIGKPAGDKIIEGKDIGVITQYSLQASKIRDELNDVGLQEVDVGNAEAFQGREKEVIIISTVKSNHLGYYWTARRFNVAVTRAQTSLLIVGDPRALQTNIYWWYFLKFYHSRIPVFSRPFVLNNKFGFTTPKISTGDESEKSKDLFEELLTDLKIDDENSFINFGYRYGSCLVVTTVALLIILVSIFVFVSVPYVFQLF